MIVMYLVSLAIWRNFNTVFDCSEKKKKNSMPSKVVKNTFFMFRIEAENYPRCLDALGLFWCSYYGITQ